MAKGDRVGVYNDGGKNGIDAREIAIVSKSLQAAPMQIQGKAAGVVKRGALNIKRESREIIAAARSSKTSIPAYPFSINFRLKGRDLTEADIGPNRRGNKNQAKLGNLLEYGGMFNAPIPHLQPALENEAPRFRRQLALEGSNIL